MIKTKLLLAAAILFAATTASFAAQQTISSGTGVLWGGEKAKLNSNFTELYGHKVISGSVTGNTMTLLMASGATIAVNVASLVNTDSQTVSNFSLNSTTNVLTLTLSGGNTATVDLSGLVASGGATAINDLTDVDTTGKASGKVLKFDSSGNLVVGDDEIGAAGTGDITDVVAGTGLTGGASAGSATLGLSTATQDAIAANTAKISFDATSSTRLANTSGTNTGDQTPTSLGLVVGTNVQAFDADLTDLADGSLTGSKVGTGISGTNITTGTVPDAQIASTIARDTEVSSAVSTHAGLTDPHIGYMLESNIGTSANNYVQLNASAQLPAVSGALLTNLPASPDDQTAGEVSFTPNGTIAATTVQAAIQEVRDEAAPTASPTFTGTITVPALSGATYTGTSLVSAVQAALTANDNAVDINASTYMLTVLDDTDAATARATLGAAAALGTDDNYATDAEKVKLGNLSGTNTGDQNAGGVAFTPNGTIAATTVQAAIQEVRDEASAVDLTAPGPIGSTTPSTGEFTTLSVDDIIVAPPPTGETGEIGLKEDPANGTNEVILKAPAVLAANVTITLPTGVVPATATTACTAGQWWFDTSYWYVCVATNTWLRAALATW